MTRNLLRAQQLARCAARLDSASEGPLTDQLFDPLNRELYEQLNERLRRRLYDQLWLQCDAPLSAQQACQIAERLHQQFWERYRDRRYNQLYEQLWGVCCYDYRPVLGGASR